MVEYPAMSCYYEDGPGLQFRYIIIGDYGVGKSSLQVQFTDKRFEPHVDMDFGQGMSHKIIQLDGEAIKIKIWDTCGADIFGGVSHLYCKGAVGVLLVYDITRRETFNNLSRRWLEYARKYTSKHVTIMVVGNKCELTHQRVVSTEEGQQFAKNYGLLFMETSAKLYQNVDEVFIETATAICNKVRYGIYHELSFGINENDDDDEDEDEDDGGVLDLIYKPFALFLFCFSFNVLFLSWI